MKPVLILFGITLLPVPAAAADESPAAWYPIADECRIAAETEDARRALAAFWFEQGRAQVDREAFWEAERSFACSQAIIPHPSTLYNLARAAEWAGDLDSALRALREYLDGSPDAPNRAEAEALTVVILGRIELQDGPPPPPPLPPPPPPPPLDEAVSGEEIAGWTVIGLGCAAAAAATTLGALAGVKQEEIDDQGAGISPADRAGLARERDDFLLATYISLGVVAATALTGTLLLLFDDEDGPGATVVPAASPDAVGLAIGGRF
ncbi:MAG: hypothetical protein HY907_01620 [Deltaproteobacteria bacterium]|nr:hypothetical protein [Deltaproteobacteria bacterium]